MPVTYSEGDNYISFNSATNSELEDFIADSDNVNLAYTPGDLTGHAFVEDLYFFELNVRVSGSTLIEDKHLIFKGGDMFWVQSNLNVVFRRCVITFQDISAIFDYFGSSAGSITFEDCVINIGGTSDTILLFSRNDSLFGNNFIEATITFRSCEMFGRGDYTSTGVNNITIPSINIIEPYPGNDLLFYDTREFGHAYIQLRAAPEDQVDESNLSITVRYPDLILDYGQIISNPVRPSS